MDRPKILVQGNHSAPILSGTSRMRAKEIRATPRDSQEAGRVSSQRDFVHFLSPSCHGGNRAEKATVCSMESGPDASFPTLALWLLSCVTLGRLLTPSVLTGLCKD